MKIQLHKPPPMLSCLGLALALAICAPLQLKSAEPVETKMMDGKMMEKCQHMMEQKEKMSADTKAQDAALAEQVAQMNTAGADKKPELMAVIVTQLVEQRATMHVEKAKMEQRMMKHMMQHMQMGKASMSQCPMMKGMHDMDDMSDDAHKEHQKEQK